MNILISLISRSLDPTLKQQSLKLSLSKGLFAKGREDSVRFSLTLLGNFMNFLHRFHTTTERLQALVPPTKITQKQ